MRWLRPTTTSMTWWVSLEIRPFALQAMPAGKSILKTCALLSSMVLRKEEVIIFLTNNFELGPLVIANIYRNRWQIESFFKWIKGNLTIKALWGYSENAVKIHLWVAISTYLLLAWVKAAIKSPLTITKVSKVAGASLLTKTDLRELLDVPAPLTQNQNVNELELNF